MKRVIASKLIGINRAINCLIQWLVINGEHFTSTCISTIQCFIEGSVLTILDYVAVVKNLF